MVWILLLFLIVLGALFLYRGYKFKYGKKKKRMSAAIEKYFRDA